MDLLGREREILRILSILSASSSNCVLVGGYAVDAYAKHRFSIDCDLVLKADARQEIESLLYREGYSKAQEKSRLDSRYGAESNSYVKKIGKLPVKVELLVNALVCRQTQAAWSYDYILANSAAGRVLGIESFVSSVVPKRELLMAFKLHAARKPDIRDVVMLGETADWADVPRHLMRGDSQKLRQSLQQFLRSLDDPKLANSLKGEFGLKGSVTTRLDDARRKVSHILKSAASNVQ